MPADNYLELEQRFADWALTQPTIQAVIVVGSRARLNHPADDWSDLDLVVFATETASFLSDATWLEDVRAGARCRFQFVWQKRSGMAGAL